MNCEHAQMETYRYSEGKSNWCPDCGAFSRQSFEGDVQDLPATHRINDYGIRLPKKP